MERGIIHIGFTCQFAEQDKHSVKVGSPDLNWSEVSLRENRENSESDWLHEHEEMGKAALTDDLEYSGSEEKPYREVLEQMLEEYKYLGCTKDNDKEWSNRLCQ